MLFLSFSDSLSMWVMMKALSDTTLAYISCWSLCPSPPFPSTAPLCLPTRSLSLPPISPSIPLSFGALALCSDCIWHDLYNGFTAWAALKGITGIPEYLPASLRVGVCFFFFFSVPSVIGVSIYHSLAVCLPWQFEALCVMSGTPPHQQFYTASKSFWCAVHTVFFLSLLKSRSALLFINCCFTTPLVFPLLLTEL